MISFPTCVDVSCQPTISYSPDYKSFKFNDKNEGAKEAKAYDTCTLEELFVSDLKTQDCGVVPISLPDKKRIGNVVRKPLEASEDKLDGDHMGRHACTPNESEESKRRKRSMDYELPELVVFLQESSYQFVKDICIDQGMPSKGSCLVDNCVLDHKIISHILEPDADSKNKSTAQTMPTLPSIPKGSKPTNEEDHSKSGTKQNGLTNSATEGLDFGSRDEISIDQSTKEIVPESLLLVCEVQKEVLTSSMISPTAEKNNDNSQTSSVSITNKDLESGKSSSDCDSPAATISGTEEIQHSIDSFQQSLETGNSLTNPEVGISESLTESTQVQLHSSTEDQSNPFGVGNFSALIAHHVAATPSFRSVSHRSNSSTTSSRSFAFPILASEWHGSPEKMVKPDKRQLKKHHGKCISFLCCKF